MKRESFFSSSATKHSANTPLHVVLPFKQFSSWARQTRGATTLTGVSGDQFAAAATARRSNPCRNVTQECSRNKQANKKHQKSCQERGQNLDGLRAAAPSTLVRCVIKGACRGNQLTCDAADTVTRLKTFILESHATTKPQMIMFVATGAAEPSISHHLHSHNGLCGD